LIVACHFLFKKPKAIWISSSGFLANDAERDLTNVGVNLAKLPLIKLSTYGFGTIHHEQGVLFCTYTALCGGSTKNGQTHYQQIIDWAGKDFNGIVNIGIIYTEYFDLFLTLFNSFFQNYAACF